MRLLFFLLCLARHAALQDSECERVPFGAHNLPHVAIVTAYRPAKASEGEKYADVHEAVLAKSIDNFMVYSHATGVPVFFLNEHLFRADTRAHFVLIDAFTHYLDLGYDWVFWTDVDFLFMDLNTSLRTIAAHAAADGYCAVGSYEVFTPGKLMSGTFMVRNANWTREMLHAWEHEFYPPVRHQELHTQDAFENMMRQSWRRGVQVLPAAQFMTYGSRARPRDRVFGVHFPGGDKYKLFFQYYNYFVIKYKLTQRRQRVGWLLE